MIILQDYKDEGGSFYKNQKIEDEKLWQVDKIQSYYSLLLILVVFKGFREFCWERGFVVFK